MKILANKGQKIINIGNIALLPDSMLTDEKTVATALSNPVITSLIKKGFLEVKEITKKKTDASKSAEVSTGTTSNGSDGSDAEKPKDKK